MRPDCWRRRGEGPHALVFPSRRALRGWLKAETGEMIAVPRIGVCGAKRRSRELRLTFQGRSFREQVLALTL